MEHRRLVWPNVLHIHQREPASQQRPNLRHANCNANGDSYSDTYADFNTNVNSDSYGYSYSASHANGDADTDGNAHADSGNTDGDAYVPAWGHTWAMGYRRARATHSLSRWWNDRWNLRLRLRWPNLHRRLP